LDEIYNIVSRLSGLNHSGKKDLEITVLKGLKRIEKKISFYQKEEKKNAKQINEILKVIMSMANLDFNKKADVSKRKNDLDALALGINMLGEELQSSTISLNEKDVLLKEIHHRVKNNLQIISSLLNLQANKTDNSDLLEAFNESKNRIKAMALVHEKLYQSKDLSKINMDEYIKSFLLFINEVYDLNMQKITLHSFIDLPTPYFELDKAIPCALILNELISNSCKYAFPKNRKGNIFLYFGIEKLVTRKEEYVLELSDDGIGFPQGINISNANSLGLQLVDMLSTQIDGKLKMDRTEGTRFTLRFPVRTA
jgi:two-component sensor histidine kinase